MIASTVYCERNHCLICFESEPRTRNCPGFLTVNARQATPTKFVIIYKQVYKQMVRETDELYEGIIKRMLGTILLKWGRRMGSIE